MKRDRVYLSDRLPFAPDQASALTRLMAVLESSFDGIFITDGQATPLWCNHSYEIISGLTAADVLGIPMAQLVATGVISHSSTLKALNQGQAVTLEQTFTTGKQAVVTSTPIYDQDDTVCLVVTNVRDISERLVSVLSGNAGGGYQNNNGYSAPQNNYNNNNYQASPQQAAPQQQPANNDSMSYGNLSDFEEILSDGDVPF